MLIFNFGIKILLLSPCVMKPINMGKDFQSHSITNFRLLFFMLLLKLKYSLNIRLNEAIKAMERERAIFKVYPNNAIMLQRFNFPLFPALSMKSSTTNSFPKSMSHFVDFIIIEQWVGNFEQILNLILSD